MLFRSVQSVTQVIGTKEEAQGAQAVAELLFVQQVVLRMTPPDKTADIVICLGQDILP